MDTKISRTQHGKIHNFGIQSKTTGHTKKQENTTHNERGSQSSKTNSEIIQMIELIDKSIIIVIMTIFHMFKTLEDGLSMLNRQASNK